MNVLPIEKQRMILHLMCEGMSMRSISRTVDVSINTVTKLLVECGKAAQEYQDKHLVNIRAKNIQCDELWSFCHTKRDHVREEDRGTLGLGDVWTWTAIDADSKLMVHWFCGERTNAAAQEFIFGLKEKLATRVQLSTDGNMAYFPAVDDHFGAKIDYGMLNKVYSEKKLTMTKIKAIGEPEEKRICTSHVERHNLTIRMGMRRFTRRTNAHSKKLENHCAALALYMLFYNYARVHSSIRVTPAMQAGISEHVWSLDEILALRNKGE